MIPHSKVFVGGLPSGSKPHELRRLFENYGVVTECDIMNRCGFVHMETPQMADIAIRALHNTTFKGAVIVVEPGRPKNRNASEGGSMRRSGIGGVQRQRFDAAGPESTRDNFAGRRSSDLEDRGVGPMRRDRNTGSRRGGEPYNRNSRGSGGNFSDSFQSGSKSRSYDTNSGSSSNYSYGPPNSYGGGNNSGMASYGSGGSSGSYGMGNQDKRGFALPDHSYQTRRGPMMTPPDLDSGYSQIGRGGSRSSNPNLFGRQAQTYEDDGIGRGFSQPESYGRSMGRGGIGLNQPEQQFIAQNRDVNRFNQGNSRSGAFDYADGRINQDYDTAFPPLSAAAGQQGGFRGSGGGGWGYGRGGGPSNRNGPLPQQGMMSNRY